MMEQLAELTAADAALAAPLLPPEQQGLLASIGEPGVVAMGASVGGQAQGIAVAQSHGDHTHLLYLAVAPPHRNRGVGTRLLAGMEQAASARGSRVIDALYLTSGEFAPLERVLAKRGWAAPQTEHRIYWATATMMNAPFIRRFQLPPGYEVFPWHELAPAEMEALEQRHAETPGGWYPPGLGPGTVPQTRLDATTSLGLRHHGQVVGWVLARAIEGHILVYEVLFVSPELQRLGRGFMLLAESIRRHCQRPDAEAMWRVRPDNTPMIHFVEKRMGQWLVDCYEERSARKDLAVLPTDSGDRA